MAEDKAGDFRAVWGRTLGGEIILIALVDVFLALLYRTAFLGAVGIL